MINKRSAIGLLVAAGASGVAGGEPGDHTAISPTAIIRTGWQRSGG